MRRALRALAALAALGMLTSCAGTSTPDPAALTIQAGKDAAAAGSAENAAAMADGDLTEDEYFSGARRYQECYAAEGVVLPEPITSPVDGLTLEWIYPDEAFAVVGDAAAELQKCNEQWAPMSAAYALHPAYMDPKLRDAVVLCMRDKGYEATGKEERVADFVGDPSSDQGAQSDVAVRCIMDSSHEVFPEIPQVTVSY